MSDPFDNVPFPHWPLRAAAALAVFSVVAVSVVRLLGLGTGPTIESPTRVDRELRFVDRRAGGRDVSAGGIDVIDARTGRKIDELRPGADGFIRATLRGLARERMRRGQGAEVPFHLVLHMDGRLTLEDPVTARTLELEAFGPANSGAFARLLPAVAPVVATQVAAQQAAAPLNQH